MQAASAASSKRQSKFVEATTKEGEKSAANGLQHQLPTDLDTSRFSLQAAFLVQLEL